ncbi:hypothetical protein [Actinopolymorpha alba]|uniref:hypothetical protein n=1 Tax=Actinopolymorpha alba TaxID=533267 RepID=UPI0003A5E4AF|nr:hypothetical protein [Actinopolymorpha alba]
MRGAPLPGYLAPTPHTPTPDLAEEVELLRATDPATVNGGQCGLDELATTVTAYWEVALASHWRRLRDLLEVTCCTGPGTSPPEARSGSSRISIPRSAGPMTP